MTNAPRRWLPDGVSEYKDRHGKARYRWRKAGHPTHNFTAEATPGSEADTEMVG